MFPSRQRDSAASFDWAGIRLSRNAVMGVVMTLAVMQTLAEVRYGFYINPYRAIAPLAVLFLWAWVLTWFDKDSLASRLPRIWLNTAFLGVLAACYLLFFTV